MRTPLVSAWRLTRSNCRSCKQALAAMRRTPLCSSTRTNWAPAGLAWRWSNLPEGNSARVAFSNGVVNILSTPPSILSQPQSQTNTIFSTATFSVTATGSLPLSYQWQLNGMDLPAQTNSTLVLPGVRPAQAGRYQVVVSNAVLAVTSVVAVLTVNRQVRISSTNGPTGTEVDVPIELLANGDETALGFSLRFDPGRLTFRGFPTNGLLVDSALNVNSNGAASGALAVTVARPYGQNFTPGTQTVVRVRFLIGQTPGNSPLTFADSPVLRELVDGTATALPTEYTAGAVLAQAVPPVITQQPASQNVLQGTSASFNVVAQGSLPLSYQWQRNTVDLPGATSATLTLNNVLVSQAGSYSARISNVAGATNSASAILNVQPPPGDLYVLAFNAPGNIVAGQPVTVTWTVTNQGTLNANAPWRDQLFVSENAAGGGARPLGEIVHATGIPANQSVIRTGVVIVPVTAQGLKYLGVTIDSGYQVPESNETNNTFVSATPSQVLAPDLAISGLDAPAAAQFGGIINISWAVTNIGTTAAAANWSDRIYLSRSSNSLASALALGTVAVGTDSPLPAGSGYVRSQNVSLPLSPQWNAGQYFLLVLADVDGAQSEVTETNNAFVFPINLTLPPLPDLAVMSVSVPTNAVPGEPFPISWAVTNQGAAAASGIWTETITLNGDPARTLAWIDETNALAAGAVFWRTQTVTFPADGPAGA